MNKLKEINGKYYQEVEVVMFEANIKVHKLWQGQLALNNGKLFILDEDRFKRDGTLCAPQHLYFLSNEKIKENDWCLYGNEVYRASFKLNQLVLTNKNRSFATNSIPVRKVIATTDTSLGLPQPSKEFIQAYIKAYNKPITKVLVEYDAITLNEDWSKRPVVVTNEYKLKVNSSNEITIKKVKDSWTREEVIELLSKHFVQAGSKIGLGQDVTKFTKTWIEENL